jgi:Ca2+-binding RTX toxin-like protein
MSRTIWLTIVALAAFATSVAAPVAAPAGRTASVVDATNVQRPPTNALKLSGRGSTNLPAEASARARGIDKFKRPLLRHGVLTVEGTPASDKIALRLRAGDPGTLQVDVGDDGSAEFSFDRERVTSIAVAAGAGNDLVCIDDGNGAFTNSIPTTIAGDDGNDFLLGGAGAERLVGGAAIDTIDGNGGNDLALMGAGDDVFIWDPGDGSDVLEGQDGTDRMLFNGADGAEQVDLSANGNRLRFFRDPGRITMDTAGVERVDFNAFGGADLITINDLRGTDVSAVDLDLGLDGSGDAQDDQVTVNGTPANDTLDVRGDASRVIVSGGRALVSVVDHEPANRLIVNGLDGNDAISAAGLAAGAISLTLDGGASDDTITGGAGVETLVGDDGSDSIDGNGANDVAFMGAGDDTFIWDPGDGSDRVEGQDDTDTMLFNGAAGDEQVDLSANGNRLRFFRTQGIVTMDTAGVEQVDFNALGGADLATINDLTGTDVRAVNLDLGVSDGKPDRVVVNGTNGDDTITVFGDAGGVNVKGLAAIVAILHSEIANDRLEINTLAGTDGVDSRGLATGVIQLFVDGVRAS